MHRYLHRAVTPLAAVAVGLGLVAGTDARAAAPTRDDTRHHHWTAAWAASPQAPSTGFTPNWSQEGFSRQTVRQVVRVTEGATGSESGCPTRTAPPRCTSRVPPSPAPAKAPLCDRAPYGPSPSAAAARSRFPRTVNCAATRPGCR